jgi:hypothetical protein
VSVSVYWTILRATGRELAALQEKHTETLAQALSDAAGLFRCELRDVQEQQQAAEEELRFNMEQSSQQIQVQCWVNKIVQYCCYRES